jgi:PhnB protein
MSITLNPYLRFRDEARAAMTYYQEVLGGQLEISTFGEFGEPSAPGADLVMHASLVTPHGLTLMASDTPPGMELSPGTSMTVSLSGDEEELRDWFEKLADGGTVTMPMAKQPWGDEFGMLTDRFGVPWMVNLSEHG